MSYTSVNAEKMITQFSAITRVRDKERYVCNFDKHRPPVFGGGRSVPRLWPIHVTVRSGRPRTTANIGTSRCLSVLWRMKKIVIFGATGMTGLCTVEAALKQGTTTRWVWRETILGHVVSTGLEVRALLRDPSRMPEELRDRVEVVTGDVLVKEDVDKVVEGRDAIVVTLGTRNDLGIMSAR